MNSTPASPDRILRLPITLSLVNVSRSTWLNQVKAGLAPQPVRLGPRSVGWRESEVLAHIAGLPRAA
jgi:prophage regulatory protein